MIRLPRLLDSSMNERARLMPFSLSANIVEFHNSLPTVTMTIGENETIQVRDFVEVYGNDGSLGVFRVSSVGNVYGDSKECSLTHALITLQDSILRGQGVLSSNPKTALETLLDAQSVKRWKIGTVEATENIAEPMDYDNTNVYDGIKTVISLLPEYTFSVDQASYPWTLNVVKKPKDVRSEGRLSRNISSLRVTVDDSELCTRLVLDGSDRYWDADTIGTWGEVARTFSTGSDLSDDATDEEIETYLEKTVAEYFDKHKNPVVSVEIDGFDFSQITGEVLDRVTVGDMYRLALPDYGTTIVERVVSVSYADMINAPDRVTIYLNNRAEDAAMRMAGLLVSVQTVEKTVEKTVQNLDGTIAGLRAFYDEFLIENENWKHTVSEVYVQLDAINTSLDLKAERSEVTALDVRLSSAELSLDGLNAEIEIKVSLNGVISAINLTTEEARIEAKRIVLDGYVTTSKLSAEIASIQTGISTKIVTSSLSASSVSCSTLTVTDASFRPKTLSYTDGNGNAATMVVLAA